MLINFPIICQKYQTQMFYSKMEFKHYLSNKLTMWIKIKQGKSWYMCLHWAVSTCYIPFFLQQEKKHNTDLHYSDLTFDDKPRSRKPIQIYDLNGLNNSPYSSEVMMPSVWAALQSFRDLGANTWYLRNFWYLVRTSQ